MDSAGRVITIYVQLVNDQRRSDGSKSLYTPELGISNQDDDDALLLGVRISMAAAFERHFKSTDTVVTADWVRKTSRSA